MHLRSGVEDRVEGNANGVQMLAHGNARRRRVAGFDRGQDAPVLLVGRMLAVRHHVQGLGLVGEGVPDVGDDVFEDLVPARPRDQRVEAGVQAHPHFGVVLAAHRGNDVAQR